MADELRVGAGWVDVWSTSVNDQLRVGAGWIDVWMAGPFSDYPSGRTLMQGVCTSVSTQMQGTQAVFAGGNCTPELESDK